eukprot:1312204-Pyramimonas_sp.AAC.1
MEGNQSFKCELKKYAPHESGKTAPTCGGGRIQGQRMPMRTTTRTQTSGDLCPGTGAHACNVVALARPRA